MKVAVIGLGYVGAVTSVCLANDGHTVVGVDLDETKLALLRSGRSPIIEAEIETRTANAVRSGALQVQSAIDPEVIGCDIVFVCVGTPSAPNGSQDLSALERVAREIGAQLSKVDSQPAIVVRSTVPPGTTDGLVRPGIESASGKQSGSGFGLCFQPEFLREGSSVKDFYNPPFTVAGGDEQAVEAVRALFQAFPGDFHVTDTQSAELLKVACNSFHALKVTFANEIGRLGQRLGLDPRQVMAMVCMDKQLNISEAYLRPGYAFGGSCLPKDLRSLLYLARSSDASLPMLEGVIESNQRHAEHGAELVMRGQGRRVGMLGLSFKQGTDDLRESPLVGLAERLIGKGYQLKIYDPAVSLAMLVGANKRYIESTIPHIGELLSSNIDDVLTHAQTVVLGHSGPEIDEALLRHRQNLDYVVDLVGTKAEAWEQYQGICW